MSQYKNHILFGDGNFGINLLETRYALILNPDTVCDTNFFIKINDYFNKEIKFSIIGATYKDEKTRGDIPDLDEHREKILKEFT